VREIRWVFGFWATPNLLLGGFGHRHNNGRKIEHTRESTGEIRKTGLSKELLIGEEMVELPCVTIIFLTTSPSVGPWAPAGRPGPRQSGRWPHPAGLGHQKPRPGLGRPKSPQAGRAIETPGGGGLPHHHRLGCGAGRLVPAPAEEDAESEAPEWELRERREGNEERGGRRPRSWVPEVRNSRLFPPRPPSWRPRKEYELKTAFLCSFLCLSLAISLVSIYHLGLGVKGIATIRLQTDRGRGGLRTGTRQCVHRPDIGRTRSGVSIVWLARRPVLVLGT